MKKFILMGLILIAIIVGFSITYKNAQFPSTQDAIQATFNRLKEIPNFKIETGAFQFIRNDGQVIQTDIPITSEEQGYITRDNLDERGETLALIVPKMDAAQIYVSQDGGDTWTDTIIDHSQYGTFSAVNAFIAFENDQHGWALVASDVGLGHQDHFIYQTYDGGQTWQESPNANDTYSRVVSGIAFKGNEEAYMSFRYDIDVHGPLYHTEDGGQNWESFDLTYPSDYNNIGLTLASARFDGDFGIIPVCQADEADYKQIVFYFYTQDGGKTWYTSDLS